eukprot:CAMPEP_0174854562 /NCGR_PEP_ID=MMETSP1114-20130205/31699_1 /TAXON_ID=312471 /ORGANISM="Neobodo designis, Strain CCAP 1951/1" /LENGTH=216 /DNA_ID=CAMNT_0016089263 /DNA_START=24 /DNA_END=675 /DNA_ORIENTATION=+
MAQTAPHARGVTHRPSAASSAPWSAAVAVLDASVVLDHRKPVLAAVLPQREPPLAVEHEHLLGELANLVEEVQRLDFGRHPLRRFHALIAVPFHQEAILSDVKLALQVAERSLGFIVEGFDLFVHLTLGCLGTAPHFLDLALLRQLARRDEHLVLPRRLLQLRDASAHRRDVCLHRHDSLQRLALLRADVVEHAVGAGDGRVPRVGRPPRPERQND